MKIKMKRAFKLAGTIICIATLMLSMAACGDDGKDAGGQVEDNAGKGIEKISVACMDSYYPYAYIDEQGNAAGFDVDIMKEAAKRCGYEIEVIATAWDSLFPGLDSGKWDAVANQIVRTDEREELYNVGNIPYVVSSMQMVVKADNAEVTSLEGLHGGKVAATVGDYATVILEDYLEEHPGAYEIVYSEASMAMILEDIINNRVIANVNDPFTIITTAEQNGIKDQVKVVGDKLYEECIYAIYQKNDRGVEIRKNMDSAMETMIDDGFLSELSMTWFGMDNNKNIKDGYIKE